jgi:hypothetical protein
VRVDLLFEGEILTASLADVLPVPSSRHVEIHERHEVDQYKQEDDQVGIHSGSGFRVKAKLRIIWENLTAQLEKPTIRRKKLRKTGRRKGRISYFGVSPLTA